MNNKESFTLFAQARAEFHGALLKTLFKGSDGVPANADRASKASVSIAKGILEKLGSAEGGDRLAGQTSGNQFEGICESFLQRTFNELSHLRPGSWNIRCVGSRNRAEIAKYEQYEHLTALQLAAKKDPNLAAALGSDYAITPDILISRETEEDASINRFKSLVDDTVTLSSSLRKSFNPVPLLHASISCKWTIRSDRAQNARSEALNLIRNRKGHLPHIVVVTGEPLPSRIASIALGTGDIDCVYHFALYELIKTVESAGYEDAVELLQIMVNGKRLKDISDLPMDLAV